MEDLKLDRGGSGKVAQLQAGIMAKLSIEDGLENQLNKEDSGSGRESSSTEAATDGPSWANLNPDALAEIFSHIPFEERLRRLPLVCKAWRSASSYPACWRYLDMQDWFNKRAESDYLWEFESEPTVEKVVMKAVDMSQGQLKELRVRHCPDSVVHYITDRSVIINI
jgi:hypothetical protein